MAAQAPYLSSTLVPYPLVRDRRRARSSAPEQGGGPQGYQLRTPEACDRAIASLVLIRRWFNPPIVAGMVASENAYGPIKMTASADDVFPTTKIFRFEPDRTPMIFELDTDV